MIHVRRTSKLAVELNFVSKYSMVFFQTAKAMKFYLSKNTHFMAHGAIAEVVGGPDCNWSLYIHRRSTLLHTEGQPFYTQKVNPSTHRRSTPLHTEGQPF